MCASGKNLTVDYKGRMGQTVLAVTRRYLFGVRLHESGLIKANPQKLIAEGTDWRFLNELEKELEA